ncbi:MAG: chemotaxis protein CheD [Ruminiclostridium sp.]|nr:chemotaxis protein CheD [Ruminiclostridium sp.]
MEKIIVGISDVKTCTEPSEIVTYALGSCVGICMRDGVNGVSGMAHIMLPDSTAIQTDGNRMKFADTGIELLYNELIKLGAVHSRLTAKIAGGANMFGSVSNTMNIGERNVIATKKQLEKLGVPITAEDTGLDYGRTIKFNSEDGSLLVMSSLKGNKTI